MAKIVHSAAGVREFLKAHNRLRRHPELQLQQERLQLGPTTRSKWKLIQQVASRIFTSVHGHGKESVFISLSGPAALILYPASHTQYFGPNVPAACGLSRAAALVCNLSGPAALILYPASCSQCFGPNVPAACGLSRVAALVRNLLLLSHPVHAWKM
eukprot:scaffold137224_cov16-Tisochrysis_lutea.AAC.1